MTIPAPQTHAGAPAPFNVVCITGAPYVPPTANGGHGAQLDRFIARCLDPQPRPDLLEIRQNREARRERFETWRRAKAHRQAAEAWLNWVRAISHYGQFDPSAAVQMKAARALDSEAIAAYRASTRALIKTPVAYVADLKDKRAIAKRPFCIGLTDAEVEEILAEDERWLAAHPVKTGRQVRKSANGEARP